MNKKISGIELQKLLHIIEKEDCPDSKKLIADNCLPTQCPIYNTCKEFRRVGKEAYISNSCVKAAKEKIRGLL